jgi:hypothetical protein
MKILLITPYFSPDDSIGSARWNRLSKYFLKNDCEIYVIASDLSSISLESDLCNDLVRVSYKKSFIDSLLSRVSNAKKDFSVEQKRQNIDHIKKHIIVSIYSKAIEVIGRFMRFPGAYWWSASEIIKVGIPIIKRENIDIIIATHPFAISLRAAHIISAKTKTPWIADMRDGWSSYYYGDYKFGTVYYWILNLMEKFYLRTASNIVSVNKSLSNSINCKPSKIRILTNVFDPDECVTKDFQNIDKKSLNFGFAGSVHPNHCWDLFFEAISNSSSEMQDGRVKIQYYGGNYDYVLEKVYSWRLKKNLVNNHGHLSKSNLYKSMSQCDILLVFGFSGTFGDTVTTGKIFDYIEIGKPIVVIGPSTSELAKLVIETGIGIVLSTAEEVQRFIESVIEDLNSFNVNINMLRNNSELSNYSSKTVGYNYIKLIKEILNSN